eukprot:280605_1
MEKQSNTLWLLKFQNSKSKPSSINRFIPSKHLNFVTSFKNILENNKIELIYAGCNGPYIAHRPRGSKLPSKNWDLTIVTHHNDSLSLSYKELKRSDEFTKLCKEYPLSIIYNVPYKPQVIDVWGKVSKGAGFSQFVSRFLGFFGNSFDPTFGYMPPYPFKSASYKWMASIPKTKDGQDILLQIHEICTYKDQPILVLNLMEITDEKTDEKYVEGVAPLAFATGGRVSIMGKCEGDWNQILFNYFPNPKAWYEMATSANYINQSMYKTKSKSTKDQFVQITIPIYCKAQYCFGNKKMPSKL